MSNDPEQQLWQDGHLTAALLVIQVQDITEGPREAILGLILAALTISATTHNLGVLPSQRKQSFLTLTESLFDSIERVREATK